MRRKKRKNRTDNRGQNINKLIVCNDSIRKWLTDRITIEGGVFPDLAYFFEKMGMCLPVHLDKLDSNKECFQCVDSNNRTYSVSISDGKPNFSYSMFSITYGNTISKYCFYFQSYINHTEPKIFMLEKDYCKNGNILYSKPYSFFMLLEDTELIIKTSASKFKYLDENIEFKDFVISASLVEPNLNHFFDTILDYARTTENIRNDPYFFISIKIKNLGSNTFDSITLSTDFNGKLKYRTSNNNEKFTLCENGEWNYVSERLEIRYTPPTKRSNNKFSFKAVGYDPKELISILNSLKKKATDLMKYF